MDGILGLIAYIFVILLAISVAQFLLGIVLSPFNAWRGGVNQGGYYGGIVVLAIVLAVLFHHV